MPQDAFEMSEHNGAIKSLKGVVVVGFRERRCIPTLTSPLELKSRAQLLSQSMWC